MRKLKFLRIFSSYIALTLIALAIGYASFVLFIGSPKIGVVKIMGVVLDGSTADKIGTLLKYAKDDKNIKAVVLEIDCPGGGASATEEIYLSLLELRKEKPVVVSINGGALSGAYYVAVASNFIFAKPTSLVGNVGVWMRLPEIDIPEEDLIASGPAKPTGGVRAKATSWTQIVAEGFLQSVMAQRGDNLKLSKEELSRGEIYIGNEALKHGLIDKIGSSSEAVKKAASLAGLKNYEEIDINEHLNLLRPYSLFRFSPKELSLPRGDSGSAKSRYPQFYYLDIRATE